MEASPHFFRAWWRSLADDVVCWFEATVHQGFAAEARRGSLPPAASGVSELPCRADLWAQRDAIGPSMMLLVWPMMCSLHRLSERQQQRSSGSSWSATQSSTSLMHPGWVSWVVRGALPRLTRPFTTWFTGRTGIGSLPAMAMGREALFNNGRAYFVGHLHPMAARDDHAGRQITSWWQVRWIYRGRKWEEMNWGSAFPTWRWFPFQLAGEREPG